MAEFTKIVEEETREYNTRHPEKKQPLSNLTKEERSGVKALQKRTEEVVFMSDKSGKMTVDKKENYTNDMAIHSEHKEVSQEEYKTATDCQC